MRLERRPRGRHPSAKRSIRRVGIATLLLVAATPAAAQAIAPPGAAACSGCHGVGVAGTAVPPLQGLAPDDIVAAMQAFRSGQRPATVMDRIAKGFTDEETRAIAAWVSRQPRERP
jgi:sulfide dehydrogenase cytochrome subunit